MDEPGDRDVEDREGASGEEVVVERDHRTDAPTVTIKGLRKVFGNFVAVDDLGFDMHANEIFSLLHDCSPAPFRPFSSLLSSSGSFRSWAASDAAAC